MKYVVRLVGMMKVSLVRGSGLEIPDLSCWRGSGLERLVLLMK